MHYETGSLVSLRGRDWVVQPPLNAETIMLKPLGGVDDEIIQIHPTLEQPQPAVFSLPDPAEVGDASSCSILRDAARLGLRATTGPFRSFGHIAVEPRPYQLVPLLMSMKQDVIRMLIADDVGIGKTVEALLIARELLDRGEIRRLTVLCPPQLAEQWQKELSEKFHIEARLVLASTINQLEKGLGAGTSIFEKYPFTVASIDLVKTERRKLDFIRACPDLVIIDEAHACAFAAGGKGVQQRYELVAELAAKPNQHMIFVTATPHSGKEDVFRSLLAFLSPEFATLPADLTREMHEKARRRLAEFFVQRRRADIRAFMDEQTPFPERKTLERTWSASEKWLELFNKSLALARHKVESASLDSLWRQRISWWSSLTLLRAVSSSPAAAAQTLVARAIGADEELADVDQLDQLGIQSVFDLESCDEAAIMDALPGSDAGDGEGSRSAGRNRYAAFARLAESLKGDNDPKLQALIPHLEKLLDDGFSPIIFCRFIPTAEYLTDELRKALPDCEAECVTGILPPAERENRVIKLAEKEKRLLICTDCLSEGINLQDGFNAVIHYDLSWNPTRHEQREGRVDRFGQSSREVRVLTWWGKDNPMDGMVLDVLLRKHENIRKSLGISAPAPESGNEIMETLIHGLLLRKGKSGHADSQQLLPGLADYIAPEKKRVEADWDIVADREKRSRTLFAQQSIKTEEIAESLAKANEASGALAARQFMEQACDLLGGVKTRTLRDGQEIFHFSFEELIRKKRPGLELPQDSQAFVFSLPAKRGQIHLTRTHPIVERLAGWLAETAFEPEAERLLARSGAMRTESVARKTTLLLCRFRFQIATSGEIENISLAEECRALAFCGRPQRPEWLPESEIPSLFAAQPAENVPPEQASAWVGAVEDNLPALMPHIEAFQRERAEELLREHRKIRDSAKMRNLRYRVQAQGSPDLLGIFIYAPVI